MANFAADPKEEWLRAVRRFRKEIPERLVAASGLAAETEPAEIQGENDADGAAAALRIPITQLTQKAAAPTPVAIRAAAQIRSNAP